MKHPVRVLQLIDSLHIGGAEKMAVQLANGLQQKGIPSFLCATRTDGALASQLDAAIPYCVLLKNHVLDIRALLRLRSFCKQHHITIVHAHSTSIFTAVLLKAILPYVIIVWHDHYGNSEFLAKRSMFLLRMVLPLVKGSIAVNHTLLLYAKEVLHIKNAIFLSNYPSFTKVQPETILQGIPDKRIVCLANFRIQKGHRVLLEAFTKVHAQFPEWTLHLVGAISDITYYNNLLGYVEDHHLSDAVFWYTQSSDSAHVLSQATIGVLPSLSEGLPLALLEYGLVGLPVVVTDVGDIPAVVYEDNLGWVVLSNHSESLATALEEAINNPILRTQKASNFHQHIVQDYSENTYLSQLENFYQHIQ